MVDIFSNIVKHTKDHVERHIDGLEYLCNLCDSIFRSSRSLRHQKSKTRCTKETARSLKIITRTDGPKMKPGVKVRKKVLFRYWQYYCENCYFRMKRFYYLKIFWRVLGMGLGSWVGPWWNWRIFGGLLAVKVTLRVIRGLCGLCEGHRRSGGGCLTGLMTISTLCFNHLSDSLTWSPQ